MSFETSICNQHTRILVNEINEKAIQKAFDKLFSHNKDSIKIIYCFEPLEPKPKSKNGAFTVDGAEQFSELVYSLFSQDGQKIIILAYPIYGESAQNKLLKTLEETPQHVSICWIYTPETTLLSTIKSRTIDLSASSPFLTKSVISDFSQNLTSTQLSKLAKILGKSGTIPKSWISDFKKTILK